jgi:hypothetical protein
LISNLIFELLVDDEIDLARLLRNKLLTKLETKRREKELNDQNEEETLKSFRNNSIDSNRTFIEEANSNNSDNSPISPIIKSFNSISLSNYIIKPTITTPLPLTNDSFSLLDFKSIDLAEQISLIDFNLFTKIEISEVLLWSTKQNEKLSPNLTQFTKHFNDISYWARSIILENDNQREREKLMFKFIKIMKHLRKMNNFSAYLSILSAVDSGPIQRLDWSKQITDSIADFSLLIDPKCGFKTLREAVNEAHPPIIPHM